MLVVPVLPITGILGILAKEPSKLRGPLSKSLIIYAVWGENTCVWLSLGSNITLPVASTTLVYNIGLVYKPLLPKLPKAEARIYGLPPSGLASASVNSPKDIVAIPFDSSL